MAQVGIVMGSDSDMPVMSKAADILDQLGISYEMRIISAHREPDEFFEYAKTAEEKGFKVNPLYKHCKDINEVISYIEKMGEERPNLEYDIDGIVIKVNEIELHDIIGETI